MDNFEWNNTFRYFFPAEECCHKVSRIWDIDALYNKASIFRATYKCPLTEDQLVNAFLKNCYYDGITASLFQDDDLIKLKQKRDTYLRDRSADIQYGKDRK